MSLSEGEAVREFPDGRPLSGQPRWRQDFPTDIPEDDALARREFTKFLVLTSGAFVAGQCWIGLMSLLRDDTPSPELRIAAEKDVPPGGVVEFRYPTDDNPCLLIRLEDGRLVAYGQQCSHLSCAVIPEPEQDQTALPVSQRLFRDPRRTAHRRPAAPSSAADQTGGPRGSHLRDRGGAAHRMKPRLTRAAEGDDFQRHQPHRHPAGGAPTLAVDGDDERLAGGRHLGRLAGGAGQPGLFSRQPVAVTPGLLSSGGGGMT